MNSVQVVGRLIAEPTIQKSEQNDRYSYVELATQSNFRNSHGQYTVDTFRVHVWKGMSLDILELRKVNDYLSVKGRLEIHNGHIVIIAEMIEFIA